MSWRELITRYRHLFPKESVLAQQSEAQLEQLPLHTIPIHESREGLVDLYFIPERRIRMNHRMNHRMNQGLPSGSRVRWGVYKKLCRMVHELDQLAPHFGYEAGRVEIHIFEGLRTLQRQEELFTKKYREIEAGAPHLAPEALFTETSKWVAPVKDNIPVHSTGAAVDLMLWDNGFLDMGQFGVIWGPNPTAPTFHEELSQEIKLNRLFCLLAADRAGLVNYSYEFWHFSSADRYAAIWTKATHASYGPVV